MRYLLFFMWLPVLMSMGCTSRDTLQHRPPPREPPVVAAHHQDLTTTEEHYLNQEVHDHLMPLLYKGGDDDLYALVGGLRAAQLFGGTTLPCQLTRLDPVNHTERLYVLSHDERGRFVQMESITQDGSQPVAAAQWDDDRLTHLWRTLPVSRNTPHSYAIGLRLDELVRHTIGAPPAHDVHFDYDESSGKLTTRRAMHGSGTTHTKLEVTPLRVRFHQESLDARSESWVFDKNGARVTPITFKSDGEWHRITYDSEGKLLSWRDGHHIASYVRDDQGRITRFTFSVYVGRGTCNSYGTITYDAHDRPLRIVVHQGCGGPTHPVKVVWEHDYACLNSTMAHP